MTKEFRRVAIINRGEPAMRFIHAARELTAEGRPITAIAFHTDVDRHARFVRDADEVVPLGAATFAILLPTLTPFHGMLSVLHIREVMRGLVVALTDGRLSPWLVQLTVYLTFTLSIAVTTTLLARWAVQRDVAVRT